MIRQYFNWPDIRDEVQQEISNPDTCKNTKRSNKKYGKLPAELAEEIPWSKICLDLIRPYIIRRKYKEEKLHLKAVIMIGPVTGQFEFVQNDDKRAIAIANLV